MICAQRRRTQPGRSSARAASSRRDPFVPVRDDLLDRCSVTPPGAYRFSHGMQPGLIAWIGVRGCAQPREGRVSLHTITTELSGRSDLGAIGNRWRLLLAFHVGRAGYPAIAQQLLGPMLA